MRLSLRDVPLRLTTGAFIAHAGWEKWNGPEEQAQALHGMAVGAYPFLARIPPTRFLRMLSIAEMTTGTALLLPFVPNRVAGAALTAFAGGLTTMYTRLPALHKPGSLAPTPQGVAVAKDSWMLGIGLSLLADRGPAAKD